MEHKNDLTNEMIFNFLDDQIFILVQTYEEKLKKYNEENLTLKREVLKINEHLSQFGNQIEQVFVEKTIKLKENNTTLERDIANLNKNITSMTKQIEKNFEDKSNIVIEQNAELKNEVIKLNKELSKLANQIEKEYDDKLNLLVNENQALKNDAMKLIKTLNNLTNQMEYEFGETANKIKEENAALVVEVTKLTEYLSNLKNQMGQKFEEKINKITEENEALRDGINKLNEKISNFTSNKSNQKPNKDKDTKTPTKSIPQERPYRKVWHLTKLPSNKIILNDKGDGLKEELVELAIYKDILFQEITEFIPIKAFTFPNGNLTYVDENQIKGIKAKIGKGRWFDLRRYNDLRKQVHSKRTVRNNFYLKKRRS
jgi:chromosome segregation ATPase